MRNPTEKELNRLDEAGERLHQAKVALDLCQREIYSSLGLRRRTYRYDRLSILDDRKIKYQGWDVDDKGERIPDDQILDVEVPEEVYERFLDLIEEVEDATEADARAQLEVRQACGIKRRTHSLNWQAPVVVWVDRRGEPLVKKEKKAQKKATVNKKRAARKARGKK